MQLTASNTNSLGNFNQAHVNIKNFKIQITIKHFKKKWVYLKYVFT